MPRRQRAAPTVRPNGCPPWHRLLRRTGCEDRATVFKRASRGRACEAPGQRSCRLETARRSNRPAPAGCNDKESKFFFQAFLQSIEREALVLYGDLPYNVRLIAVRRLGWPMPIAIKKRPKHIARAGQLASERTAVAAVSPIEADQRPNPVVKDPDPDQRAIATRIKAELSRDATRASQHELKSRRRELRLTPSVDDLIRCAMEVSGLTAGDLAYQGALKLLEGHYRALRVRRQRDRDRPSRFRR
jgi:hypothetical protein